MASVSGYVLDGRNYPVALASVMAMDHRGKELCNTRTDRDGHYTLEVAGAIDRILARRSDREVILQGPWELDSCVNVRLLDSPEAL